MGQRMFPLKAWLYGLAAVCIWCSIPLGVKWGAESLDWSWILILRFMVSTVLFFPLVWRSFSKMIQTGPWVVPLGVLCLGMNYVFQTWAMTRLPVSLYTLTFTICPLLTLLSMNRRGSFVFWGGAILSIGGVWITLDWKTLSLNSAALPFLSLLGGMLAWVGVTHWMIRCEKHLSSVECTAWMQPLSLIGVLPIWSFRGSPIAMPTGPALVSVLLLGLGVPAAFWFYGRALRENSQVSVATQYLEPVIGCAIGILVLGEVLGPLQIAGGALILVGQLVLSRGLVQ